jgi:hypothetical protein
VLGDLVAGEQGYVDLKKKLVKSALRPLLFAVFGVAFFLLGQSQVWAQKVREGSEMRIIGVRIFSRLF